jgi:hypothetical protein
MESLDRYPRDLAGLALLLLRVAVALLLLVNVQGESWFKHSGAAIIFAVAIGIGFCAGIFTPLLSGAAFVGWAAYLFWIPGPPSLLRVVTLMLCLSTAILGAGAYSVDGVLFGRRRVIL